MELKKAFRYIFFELLYEIYDYLWSLWDPNVEYWFKGVVVTGQ